MVISKPVVHHYSWVRTEEELRQKVRTWGHRHDRKWVKLIEKEFSQPFAGVDRILGFKYETVSLLHDVLKESFYEESGEVFPHVARVDRKLLFEKTVQQLLK